MGSWLTFSTLGGAVLVAAAGGIVLGESAVDEINPLYYRGAAVHPRDRGAAVEEPALAPTRGRFADHYGWEEGHAARSIDCNGCDALGARDAYAGGAHFAVIETGWRREPQTVAYYAESEPASEPEAEALVAEPSDIERFASFQVEEKPAAAEPVEAAADASEE
ncbi:MAG TPA: hypothetical protein VF577_05070 [Allosphingosinicella sp.]|jgi:hypothetical protein